VETALSGREFLDKLKGGGLRPSLVRVGMAKPSETDPSVLLFSESRTCGRWATVPLDLIESVQVVGWATCTDHKHPVVRLKLRDALPDNRHATLLAELLFAKDEDEASRTGEVDAAVRGAARQDPDCVHACQDACRDGPPFLFGAALGACLRRCRQRCDE
jgi:hypothetical protein